jgi:hypothetical protein
MLGNLLEEAVLPLVKAFATRVGDMLAAQVLKRAWVIKALKQPTESSCLEEQAGAASSEELMRENERLKSELAHRERRISEYQKLVRHYVSLMQGYDCLVSVEQVSQDHDERTTRS